MSAIFGIVNRNGGPVGDDELRLMQDASSPWGGDDNSICVHGEATLGRCLRRDTPEDLYDTLPHTGSDLSHEIAFTAEGRLDNREELFHALDVPSGARSRLADGELMRLAYLAWGQKAPERLLGDWSFAAWHARERRLFLARDHYGNTALYYAISPDRFAFASCIRALLALPWVDRRLNELKFAGSFLIWRTHGVETFFTGIAALPPAHRGALTADGLRTDRYWRLEDTPELRLRSDSEYVDALLATLGEAVRCRLRAIRPVAATLSAGLDSTSVTALAAREFRPLGRRLRAYTWVPAYAQENHGGHSITDEGPGAAEVASMAGNVDVHRIHGEVDPILAIRRALAIQAAPVVSPANAPWLDETYRTAVRQGVGSLLTGAIGNATVSWTGLRQQHWRYDVQRLGWPVVLRARLLRPLVPGWGLGSYRRFRYGDPVWPRRYAPISDGFARRLDLDRRLMEDAEYRADFDRSSNARTARIKILRPDSWSIGAHEAAIEGHYGLSFRAPTMDKRVMQLCFSIPDRVFSGPDRQRRWLIREAMRGLLPDSVRLSSNLGAQAADTVARLRAHAPSIENALLEAETGPLSRELLDVGKLRAAWETVRTGRGQEPWTSGMFCLLPGLQAAIFLNSEATG